MYLPDDCREMLIDLVWNKLDCIEAFDREDRQEVKRLKTCLSALQEQSSLSQAA